MRMMPQSLFGRLVLIFLAGLIFAQIATTYVNQTERDQLLYQAGGMRLAQKISDIVKLLDSLPAGERHRVVAVFNAPPLAVSLDLPPLAENAASVEADFQRSMFTQMLRYELGNEANIRVVIPEGTPETFPPPARLGPPGMPMMQRPRGGHGMPGQSFGGPRFTVQVVLHDGTRATFNSRISQREAGMPLRLALTLLILLGTVVVVALITVRWVTRPLATLASAAERLGEDIHRPPLPETGPSEAKRAAHAFNAMQQRLARFISDRTRIFTAMSHDLKTPITRMRLRSELLDDEELKTKFSKDLLEMEGMVTQTLDFMRDINSQEGVQLIDVTALLESLQADYQDIGNQIEIEGGVTATYPGKPLAMRRCLTNLISNAIRYGGHATIKVEDDAAQLVIRVIDDGPGMSEQDLERAFEPYFRAEASRNRDTGGTGLGLSIALSIARAHGGNLTLRNRPGGGMEALLSLPRVAA